MNVWIICHNEIYRVVVPFPNEWKERWVNEVESLDRIGILRIDRIIYTGGRRVQRYRS